MSRHVLLITCKGVFLDPISTETDIGSCRSESEDQDQQSSSSEWFTEED
jgi:hypothetical protein